MRFILLPLLALAALPAGAQRFPARTMSVTGADDSLATAVTVSTEYLFPPATQGRPDIFLRAVVEKGTGATRFFVNVQTLEHEPKRWTTLTYRGPDRAPVEMRMTEPAEEPELVERTERTGMAGSARSATMQFRWYRERFVVEIPRATVEAWAAGRRDVRFRLASEADPDERPEVELGAAEFPAFLRATDVAVRRHTTATPP